MFLTPQAGTTNALRFAITTSGNTGEQQLNGPTIATGVWTNIVVTLAGSSATLYVNGKSVATNTSMTLHPSSLGSTGNNYLGKSQFSTDPAFLGSIDDFRIYGRALTAAEVNSLATTHSPTAGDRADGCKLQRAGCVRLDRRIGCYFLQREAVADFGRAVYGDRHESHGHHVHRHQRDQRHGLLLCGQCGEHCR